MIERLENFLGLVGDQRGPSSWLRVDQRAVDDFARVTFDPQWIHVDPVRAAASPFGGTIAHGYFTLALVAHWLDELFPIASGVVSLNYGLERVRFPSPVRVGTRLRMSATVREAQASPGGIRVVYETVIEREGGGKPACVASPVILYR